MEKTNHPFNDSDAFDSIMASIRKPSEESNEKRSLQKNEEIPLHSVSINQEETITPSKTDKAKKQVKVIASRHQSELESELERYLNTHTVLDIDYSVSTTSCGRRNDEMHVVYSALVTFQE